MKQLAEGVIYIIVELLSSSIEIIIALWHLVRNMLSSFLNRFRNRVKLGNIIISSLIKATFASMLFSLVYVYYNLEVVRSNIEDVAFDVINKVYIKHMPETLNRPNVILFALDDLYMKEEGLFDESNKSIYGYLFPRGKIADFIVELDELIRGIEPTNRPKALFVDYDMSFTMMPYGKDTSSEDQKLLDVLKQPREYAILLPKTATSNFIEENNDTQIQKLIQQQKIVFVSVGFLKSADNVVRRYQGYESFGQGNKEYINVNVALWQLLNHQQIDLSSAKHKILKDDIVANRILFKPYSEPILDEGCLRYISGWGNIIRYSANCDLHGIIEDEFSNAIIILGGTHKNNDDQFDILNILKAETISGIDMHANTLMSILFFGGPLRHLDIIKSVALMFIAFFTVALLVSVPLNYLQINNEEAEMLLTLFLNTVVLIVLSVCILIWYHLWFNWFVPLVLYESIELYRVVRQFLIKIINRRRNNV